MNTKILSSNTILFEDRASVKGANYIFLLWSVQNWVSGGENILLATSMIYMFIKSLSKEKRERQCRFDF